MNSRNGSRKIRVTRLRGYAVTRMLLYVQLHPYTTSKIKVQSNSVITNSMGPAKFVRYNRGSL